MIITRCEPPTKNKKLRKISTAARNLANALSQKKPLGAWLKRLQEALDMTLLDFNTWTIVAKHLGKKEILYNKFLDMLWPNSYVVKNGRYVHCLDEKILPYLEHLVAIRESQATNASRWADPHLYFLIEKLAPLWREVTGRTWRHTETASGDKQSFFYEWICDILKEAGCRGVTYGQVDKIASRLKTKK